MSVKPGGSPEEGAAAMSTGSIAQDRYVVLSISRASKDENSDHVICVGHRGLSKCYIGAEQSTVRAAKKLAHGPGLRAALLNIPLRHRSIEIWSSMLPSLEIATTSSAFGDASIFTK